MTVELCSVFGRRSAKQYNSKTVLINSKHLMFDWNAAVIHEVFGKWDSEARSHVWWTFFQWYYMYIMYVVDTLKQMLAKQWQIDSKKLTRQERVFGSVII